MKTAAAISNNNTVTLAGKLVQKPTLSHEVFGEKFFAATLAVNRLSGSQDLIPVSIPQTLLTEQVVGGADVLVKGQFRSYNKIENERSKLILTVFVKELTLLAEPTNLNELELHGYVCKQPVYRVTPLEREICDLLVAVNRQYGKSDYIPCIVWGRKARFANTLPVGSKVLVSGRLQSRKYLKSLENGTQEERTAYEMSVAFISAETDGDQTAATSSLSPQSDVAEPTSDATQTESQQPAEPSTEE